MGNASSQQSQNEAEEEAVFSLSRGMQEKMAQEYNNEQVVKVFGKQMARIGEQKAEYLKTAVEKKMELKERIEKFREQNKNTQAQLDQGIESIEDRFTDMANVVEYDALRLEKKHLGGKRVEKGEIACLNERVNISSCYTDKKNDPAACDAFVTALNMCVDQTITASD